MRKVTFEQPIFYFQQMMIWIKNNANPLAKKSSLLILVLGSTLWCFARLTIYINSHYFGLLGTLTAFFVLMASGIYFYKFIEKSDWGPDSTKHIIGSCLFYFFLGLAWPYAISMADEFMEQDPETKYLLLLCVGLVYVVTKIKDIVMRVNEMLPARAVHHFFSIPKGEYVGLKKVTATHEAGHALLYACLKDVPHDVSVSIKEDISSAGRVTSLILEQSLTSAFLKWHLLVCLAGRAAEFHRYRDYSVGCSDDLRHWQQLATLYLRNGMGSFYYNTPTTKEEKQHNISAMEKLQVELEVVLAEFFSVNDEPLKAIESQLMEKKFILGKDLEVLLENVTLTKSMPLPALIL